MHYTLGMPANYRLVEFFATMELREYSPEDLKYGSTFPSIFVRGWPKPCTTEDMRDLVALAKSIAQARV